MVEKGTRIMIPVMALHHDPKHYPDPERFDPERFSEVEKKKRPHFSYLPFGEGPRNCIGESYFLIHYTYVMDHMEILRMFSHSAYGVRYY
jgi:cytochrome P450 family 6